MIKQLLGLLLLLSLFSGCTLIGNHFTYKNTTITLLNELLNEDYEKALDKFAFGHERFTNMPKDTLRMQLKLFRKMLVENFGEQLDYTVMATKKQWSTDEANSTPPNTTLLTMQIAGEQEFGVLNVWFDDQSQKVIYLTPTDVKRPIPDESKFWFFGFIALLVPTFNIYVIRKLRASTLKVKWLKYLAVITLNAPAISYFATNAYVFNLLNIQLLFGVSFSYMGYLNSVWTFGVPLGGLYWFIKLNRMQRQSISETPTETVSDYVEAKLNEQMN